MRLSKLVMRGIVLVVLAWGIVSYSSNKNMSIIPSTQQHDATVGNLVDARNYYTQYTIQPLVQWTIESILYLRWLDEELSSYGVSVSDRSFLYVEIEGTTYKIWVDVVR